MTFTTSWRARIFEEAELLPTDLISDLSIGEVSVLYEYTHAIADADARKTNGQFFTPDDVASFMAGFADRFPRGRWLDPCAGIGNLSWHLIASQEDPEEFLLERMLLSDTDELALLVARALLTAAFQRRHLNLFHEIEENFVVFDFLSVSDSGTSKIGALAAIPSHDFVIVNPPYLATKGRDSRFETAESSDLYAYFLENVIKTSRGFISVTPQSFTNAKKFMGLRSLLLRSYSNLEILCFDNIPGNLFRGVKFGSRNSNTANSIRAAITVALPQPGVPSITSLMRWKGTERQRLFAEVERFKSHVPLTAEFFPKVSTVFEDLYRWTVELPRLGSLCQRTETEFPLHVPSAPRYFIPALKSPVARSSQRTLYFPNSAARDRAYLLINSSLMYWWWRVRDGGMTLSQETLLSMPLPDFAVRDDLVTRLELSEETNKVYKLNAGVSQENVKHSPELIADLNAHIVPIHAAPLLLTHLNSEFAQFEYLGRADDAASSARSAIVANGAS
uniref:site-specific DNA-methyltransferase (adenine-specific) n=1 Tax=Cellulosimicrobium cellulans TaxID=1710 RepID=A0A0H5S032_CELCE|nr:DNA methyltransferase M.AluBI [Cellulosimicrobium cellulans]